MSKLIVPLVWFLTIFVFTCGGCQNKNTPIQKNSELVLNSEYRLDIPEPSALTFSKDGKNLWTVSDENSTAYLVSRTGEIIDSLSVQGFDLEGITVIDDSTVCVVLERERELVFLRNSGEEIRRKKLNIQGQPNSGIEGITLNTSNNHLYLVNEKDPGLLIELDEDLEIINKTELGFAKDYSDIEYIKDEDLFWILSDESSTAFKCRTDGSVVAEYLLEIPQPEGIAFDAVEKLLYIVSDNMEKMYTFRLDEK